MNFFSTMARPALLTLFALGLSFPGPARPQDTQQEEGWADLFNGKDLEGWVQRGGKADYQVEDGEIVGRSVPNTPNSFLCTEKDYDDFILELEFKVHPQLNSGVQVRSEYAEEPKVVELDGREIKIPAGRVHGYQVEIDPAARSWSGGIYDEGRRGWLNDLKDNDPAREAFQSEDWNHFRIECRGDSIKTWINDVPAADLQDSVTRSGFIALQVHGVGSREEPMEIRFRNVRIKELNGE
ncbi:hypothetical protein BH23PLA1_BH23PLA1_09960 [soil metagenome]